MKRLFPSRLTKRFLYLTTVIIFIPILIIFIFAVTSSRDIIKEQTETQAIQVTKVMSDKTSNLFNFKIQLLENIADNERQYGEEGTLEEFLTKLAVNDPFFKRIHMINESGRIEYNAPFQEADAKLSAAEEDLYEELTWRRSSFVADSMEEMNGEPTLLILVPFQSDEAGEVKGGLIAYVSLVYLQKYFTQNVIGDSGHSFLFSQDGKVLFDTNDFSKSGSLLEDYSFSREAVLDRTGVYRGELWGEESLVAYNPIDRLPFYTATSIPLEEADAVISSLKNILLQGFILIFLAALTLLVFGIRWIIKPIKTLTNEAASYARGGEWFAPVLEKEDEIKTLSSTMKYMAESLKSHERHLQLILESFPFGVIAINPEGFITSMNTTAKDLLNVTNKDLTGKSISVLPQFFRDHFEQCKHVSKKFDGLEDDFTFENEFGKKIIKQSSSPLLDEKHEVIGVLTTFWDVTKIRQLEKHIQRSEQLVAIGQMTAGLAHEVKNPLGTVQLASDLIASEIKDLAVSAEDGDASVEIISEAAKDIQDEIQRLDLLVRRFLQFSRENKKDESVFNIKTLAAETLQLLSHQFRKKQINATMEAEGEAYFVKGDRNQMIQAFINIFINSIEAVSQHGQVSVAMRETNHGTIEIEMKDDGIGIPQQKIKRIFNPFFSTKQEGTGLGLWITHDIISSHNGHIEVESEMGEGTTFLISLKKHEKGDSR
ncbi:PAS domain-containing protein [Bacillus sp. ISL-47]|uniref:sensor histidine kinase n=1 Tax=Bacillus sp. ISL-47 TaxID=2819130 RepID=UPI001BEBDEAA|nr:PAS domain-containing sensor histidine kinase [Bacillus sp. ISL-47]MBT2687403.1 PAS domain-containing protein [Bacillus sp. ISL-47]MBT2707135.1 PAS domain-containing protein [Pseudomonas sp. ISL-84]